MHSQPAAFDYPSRCHTYIPADVSIKKNLNGMKNMKKYFKPAFVNINREINTVGEKANYFT